MLFDYEKSKNVKGFWGSDSSEKKGEGMTNPKTDTLPLFLL